MSYKKEGQKTGSETVWQAACPLRCGVICHSYATRYNTRRYGVRMSVLSHLRKIHNKMGRELSLLGDKAIRDLPRD